MSANGLWRLAEQVGEEIQTTALAWDSGNARLRACETPSFPADFVLEFYMLQIYSSDSLHHAQAA